MLRCQNGQPDPVGGQPCRDKFVGRVDFAFPCRDEKAVVDGDLGCYGGEESFGVLGDNMYQFLWSGREMYLD